LGRRSFGYFSFAVVRKVTRQQGELNDYGLKVHRLLFDRTKSPHVLIQELHSQYPH